MSTKTKALKSGMWYTFSNFLVKGLGLLTTPIFTRILTKTEFGMYNNYSSWLVILTILITMNLDSTLISARFDYEKTIDKYIFSVISLSVLITLVWLFMANLFSESVSLIMGLEPVYVNIMLVYLLFLPGTLFYQLRAKYFFEYKASVIASMVLAIGTALLSVALVLSMENKLTGRIIGASLPTMAAGLLFYIYFFRKGKRIDFDCWKYAIPIALPFIPHLLSMSVLNSMDRIMITRWCGAEDAAMYSLAYNCGAIVTLLLMSINGAYGPWLGSMLHENKFDEIRDFSKTYVYSFLFFALGILLISPEILYALGGEKYMDAKYVIAPVTMGCVCQFLYTMFVNVEQYKKKTVGMAVASVLAALINCVLNYLLIPRIGYLAAAYTTLAGYLCLLLMHMYLVYRLGYGEIYDYGMIYKVVAIGIMFTVIITILYDHSNIRYCCTFMYFIIAFILFMKFKKTIIKLLFEKES